MNRPSDARTLLAHPNHRSVATRPDFYKMYAGMRAVPARQTAASSPPGVTFRVTSKVNPSVFDPQSRKRVRNLSPRAANVTHALGAYASSVHSASTTSLRRYVKPTLGSRLLGLIDSRAILTGEKICDGTPRLRHSAIFSRNKTPRCRMGTGERTLSGRNNSAKNLLVVSPLELPSRRLHPQSVQSTSEHSLVTDAAEPALSEASENSRYPSCILDALVRGQDASHGTEPHTEGGRTPSAGSTPKSSLVERPCPISRPSLAIQTSRDEGGHEDSGSLLQSVSDIYRDEDQLSDASRMGSPGQELPHSPCSLINMVNSAGLVSCRPLAKFSFEDSDPSPPASELTGNQTPNSLWNTVDVLDVASPEKASEARWVTPPREKYLGHKVDISQFMPRTGNAPRSNSSAASDRGSRAQESARRNAHGTTDARSASYERTSDRMCRDQQAQRHANDMRASWPVPPAPNPRA